MAALCEMKAKRCFVRAFIPYFLILYKDSVKILLCDWVIGKAFVNNPMILEVKQWQERLGLEYKILASS